MAVRKFKKPLGARGGFTPASATQETRAAYFIGLLFRKVFLGCIFRVNTNVLDAICKLIVISRKQSIIIIILVLLLPTLFSTGYLISSPVLGFSP